MRHLADSVSPMELDETRRLTIQGLAVVRKRFPPKAVVVALASIIGDADGVAVWPSMDTTQSTTTWSCWIVTERALGHVRIEYEKSSYDQDEEAVKELTAAAWSAWVRPLANVTGLRFGPFYATQRKPAVFEPVEPIAVIFTDAEISIPDGPIPVDERPEVDRIISAIRALVNF
jgi:hypothetical protein